LLASLLLYILVQLKTVFQDQKFIRRAVWWAW